MIMTIYLTVYLKLTVVHPDITQLHKLRLIVSVVYHFKIAGNLLTTKTGIYR